MIIQYLENKSNEMIYKAVNNCELFMWYPSKRQWGKCCTQYQDLFTGDYLNNFRFINERDIEVYLK